MRNIISKATLASGRRRAKMPTIQERFREEHNEFKENFNKIQLNWVTMSFTARNKAARQCLEEIGDMIFFSDEALSLGMEDEHRSMDAMVFHSIGLIQTFIVSSDLSSAEVYQMIRRYSKAKTALHSYVSGEGQ